MYEEELIKQKVDHLFEINLQIADLKEEAKEVFKELKELMTKKKVRELDGHLGTISFDDEAVFM